DFGKVMGLSVKKLSGQADGSKIQSFVKELLGIS
ncbi:MAG: GatB/YqeY domain-containing protein, partial [Gemmataceae bacterium]